jgi:hypothetical protein
MAGFGRKADKTQRNRQKTCGNPRKAIDISLRKAEGEMR